VTAEPASTGTAGGACAPRLATGNHRGQVAWRGGGAAWRCAAVAVACRPCKQPHAHAHAHCARHTPCALTGKPFFPKLTSFLASGEVLTLPLLQQLMPAVLSETVAATASAAFAYSLFPGEVMVGMRC